VVVGSLPRGWRCCTPARPSAAAPSSPAAAAWLSVTAVGADLAAAREAAYRGVAAVRLRGGHWRTDIALRAVEGRIALPPEPRVGLLTPTAGGAVGPLTEAVDGCAAGAG
jgi:hypothetical protein